MRGNGGKASWAVTGGSWAALPLWGSQARPLTGGKAIPEEMCSLVGNSKF